MIDASGDLPDGTKVNGQKVLRGALLPNDELSFAAMKFRVHLGPGQPDVDPQATLAWVDSFPVWAQFGWGLGVWMGLLGSILLLVRHRFAVHTLALSALGAVLGLGYQIVAAPPLAGMEGDMMMTVMPFVIIAVAIGLLLYARALASKGVLR